MSEVFGVVGWKNSGKTTLVCRLVEEFKRRGLTVSTIKHAHESFEIDKPGTDSKRHQEAGAHEVALLSATRWAIIHTIPTPSATPSLEGMIKKLGPCDVVIFEGFKKASYPKIEIRVAGSDEAELWRNDKNIIAIAADKDVEIADCPLPRFARSDIGAMVNYLSDMGSLAE